MYLPRAFFFVSLSYYLVHIHNYITQSCSHYKIFFTCLFSLFTTSKNSAPYFVDLNLWMSFSFSITKGLVVS